MRIYLCDLTHTGQGPTSELVPYAIGCLRSYLLTQVDAEVLLFKEVPMLEAAIKQHTPDIIGFSNYLWNSNLSCAIARRVKELFPSTLVVFGGPNFPLDATTQERWLWERPFIDVYVLGDGEEPFVEIVKAFMGGCITKRQYADIYGVCALSNDVLYKNVDTFPDGTDKQPRMMDLETIPSPYLNGSLDAFLSHPMFIPVLSCNRGCPFTCTYCVVGNTSCSHMSRRKVKSVIADLEYIVAHYKGHTLHLVDNNFGMFPEDVEISEAMAKIKEATGYPKWIIVATGKNKKQRVMQVVKNLGDSLRVAASVQSMDSDTLSLIRRQNISSAELLDIAKSASSTTYSEMILALPGETYVKHINGICELMDMGFTQLRLHQLFLLPGSELETIRQRSMYHMITKFRALQRSYGHYEFCDERMPIAEIEEIVVGHDRFTLDEYLRCRVFALSVGLFYNDRVFYELVMYLRSFGVPVSSFVRSVHDAVLDPACKSVIHDIYEQFRQAAQDELFDSRDELEDLIALNDGVVLDTDRIGNNLLYNTQGYTLAHNYADLCDIAFSVARQMLRTQLIMPPSGTPYLDELEVYCKAKKGHIADLDSVQEQDFHYDFVELEASDFAILPFRIDSTRFRFAFEQWQKDLFAGQMAKYGSDAHGLGKIVARTNMGQTYRKVTRV